MSSEMFKELDWPYRDNVFPRTLGAVAIRTVLAGAPALQVTHFPDGEGWGITDGGDPNAPGACIARRAPRGRPALRDRH
jgi:hypothetical protein